MTNGALAVLARALDQGVDTPEDAISERILDAALAISAASGIRNLTMDEVARRARVGRMTVYRRFGDREKLVEALGGRLPDATAQIRDASQQAFVDALGTGLTIAAAALLLAALVAWLMVNPKRPDAEVPVEVEVLPEATPAGTVA
jgi:AcrR family transcriptional regulator